MLKIYGVLFSVLMLQGCAIVPGMNQTDPPSIEGLVIEEITPDFLKRQMEERRVWEAGEPGASGGPVAMDADDLADPDYPYKYLVGPRDVLNILVWEHPELTTPSGQFRSAETEGRLVSEDGTMFYPYVGVVKVAGLTVSEIRTLLTRRLSKHIVNPQLDVNPASFRSQKAFVVGQVAQPGPQRITDRPLTVIDAIDSAGDFSIDADKTNVTLSRGDKTYNINMLDMYELGDLSRNYILQDGDVLHVPDRSLQKIFVLGEVRGPETIKMENGRMTLTEALGAVGGVNQVTSNPNRIYVIRGNPDEPAIYHLNAKSPDALILANVFHLEPRDVVFVGTAGVTKWNRVISQLLPTAQFISGTTIQGLQF